ncbi:MAG: tetratricopeptide repeat protein [Pseudomonadota bacterium]
MLPPYCDAKMGRQNPADVEYWRARMGHENWIHMHHYCGGLIELNRYYRAAKGKQRPNLGNAVNEFTGMINGWAPGFYLRPEAHLNRGRAYKFMRHDGKALADFTKALELDPGLTPASVELADLYKAAGKKQDALDVLKRALERKPDSKVLKRRYAELGGDAASIVPILPASPATPTAPSSAEPSVPASPAAEAPPTAKPPVELVDPKIGSPKNPYCRFCPD